MSVPIRPQVISTSTTAPRATLISGGQKARTGAKNFGLTLLRAVEGAAGFLPGGSVATASLRGLSGAGSYAGASSAMTQTAAGAGSGSQLIDYQQLLNTQMEMQKQNIHYSTITNVLKSEHDTKKQIVTNYR